MKFYNFRIFRKFCNLKVLCKFSNKVSDELDSKKGAHLHAPAVAGRDDQGEARVRRDAGDAVRGAGEGREPTMARAPSFVRPWASGLCARRRAFAFVKMNDTEVHREVQQKFTNSIRHFGRGTRAEGEVEGADGAPSSRSKR